MADTGELNDAELATLAKLTGVDIEQLATAGVTRKEYDALRLYERGRAGYRTVGMALGIAPETVVGRIARGIRKIEEASRRGGADAPARD